MVDLYLTSNNFMVKLNELCLSMLASVLLLVVYKKSLINLMSF